MVQIDVAAGTAKADATAEAGISVRPLAWTEGQPAPSAASGG